MLLIFNANIKQFEYCVGPSGSPIDIKNLETELTKTSIVRKEEGGNLTNWTLLRMVCIADSFKYFSRFAEQCLEYTTKLLKTTEKIHVIDYRNEMERLIFLILLSRLIFRLFLASALGKEKPRLLDQN